MASRAEEGVAGGDTVNPAARLPRLGTVIRASFTDYYFNSMRLVPANVIWGAGFVAVILVTFVWPLAGLLLLSLLALPTAGIFRLAAGIVRVSSDSGWNDLAWPYRRALGQTLALGVGLVGASAILVGNVLIGIGGSLDVAGLVLATLAGWGLVAVWAGALVAWPVMVDPARDGMPMRAKLRLAGALLLVHPARLAALAAAVAIITLLSTVLTAALLTISVAFVALVACRMVLPAADRLQATLSGEGP